MNDPNTEETIFSAARQMPPEDRAAYLDRACGDNGPLRRRVEALLNAAEQAGDFLEVSAAPMLRRAPDVSMPLAEKPGDKVGRYKLLQQIGEGGCGVVYMAEQEEPVRRRVALKIIKLGMDTRNVIARFEAERQALALMDHPNIAKVFDAGATETGRPYFVMELVRGVKITEYCDELQLSIRARLDLFTQVCQAIQHAHQKGIIHRDIKPSNILVTVNDGVPVPKVIDFGIVKATGGQQLTDKTIFTAFEQFIGTPAYMSPEQAVLTSVDIDTRSDIYALGVLLYEMLTGKTPFDANELLAAGLDELRQTIREQEPERPSTRLRTMPDKELSTAAQRRGLNAPKLVSELRGDLDWIVMKCLEKDRACRYETANDLARDIERHWMDEPVVARRPSAAYRLRKFVRRNKVMVTSGAIIGVVMVLGSFLSTWEAIRARQAEREQIRLRQAAEKAQEGEAQQRQHAETLAYSSDMNLAEQAISVDNLGRALELLNRHRPATNSADLRGWEWRYLWRMCQSDALYALCQQTNSIYSLAVSHNGKWLAVGDGRDEEGGLSIWDLAARQQIVRLPTGGGGVRVAFSFREPLLAFSIVTGRGEDREYGVRLWDLATRQSVAELALGGHGRSRVQGNACTGLAFSEDGRTLLTATANPANEISIWRVPDGRKLAVFEAPQRGNIGTPFAVTRDLKVAAYESGHQNKMLRVVDLAAGREIWTVRAVGEGVMSLAFSPNGKLLATGWGYDIETIGLWDVASGRDMGHLEGHRGWVGALAFSPDGRTLASASADQTIRLWDVSDPDHLPAPRTLRGHQNEVWRLALAPDGATLVSGSKDGAVYVWNTSAPEPGRAHLVLPVSLLAWRFAPDSKSVFAVDRQGRVAQWRGSDFQEQQPIVEIATNVLAACISQDCRLVAALLPDGIVQIWSLPQRIQQGQFEASAGGVAPWQFLANGEQLAILNERDSSLEEWDLKTWQKAKSWTIPPNTQAIAYSPDEKWSFALGFGGASSLIDRAAGRQTEPRLETRQAAWGAFSPDGGLFAVASHLAYVRLWSMSAARGVGTLGGFLGGCQSVAFSPDGKRLATGRGGSDAMKIWDVGAQQELLTLAGDGSSFRFTSFSPDGNLLGSMDFYRGILNLWRAPGWSEIQAAERAGQISGGSPKTRDQMP